MSDLQLLAVHGILALRAGAHLADALSAHADLQDGDVLLVASHLVSAVENRIVPLDDDRAAMIERESVRVLRTADVIAETEHGFITGDAGIQWRDDAAVLLPKDADRTAFKIRERVRAVKKIDLAVVVTSAFDRAWRRGQTGVAVGSSGIEPVVQRDGVFVCIVDELAAAAELVMQMNNVAVVIARGVEEIWLSERTADVGTNVVPDANEILFR